MSWLTHKRSWRSEFVWCLASGCSMIRSAVARFRQGRLVLRLRFRLLQLDQIIERRRRHRFELSTVRAARIARKAWWASSAGAPCRAARAPATRTILNTPTYAAAHECMLPPRSEDTLIVLG